MDQKTHVICNRMYQSRINTVVYRSCSMLVAVFVRFARDLHEFRSVFLDRWDKLPEHRELVE